MRAFFNTHSDFHMERTDNTDIFADSLLYHFEVISFFSSLILVSIVMISFYILSKRFFLKRERLSDARVTSITKKVYGMVLQERFCKDS